MEPAAQPPPLAVPEPVPRRRLPTLFLMKPPKSASTMCVLWNLDAMVGAEPAWGVPADRVAAVEWQLTTLG